MLDCTDSTYAKMALASYCRTKQIPLMMSGSAGGRIDPTCIKVADLSVAFGDMLLSKVRKQLRQSHDFPKAPDMNKRPLKKPKEFGVLCVYSDELVTTPEGACDTNENASQNPSISGLNCAGFGSSVTVTASMGFNDCTAGTQLLDGIISVLSLLPDDAFELREIAANHTQVKTPQNAGIRLSLKKKFK